MLVDDFGAQVTVKNLIVHSAETRLKNFIDRVMEITWKHASRKESVLNFIAVCKIM